MSYEHKELGHHSDVNKVCWNYVIEVLNNLANIIKLLNYTI